ncbi:MAG: hypothetical protein FD168_1907 [Desulfobulbaceae bacterium]|jgi:hypothetical protein|nr:MAG: hypothetical protein FD168_1907 [Desulfobulbaceae bacterium]
MANTISTIAHIDPQTLRQHNNKNLQPLEPKITTATETPIEQKTSATDTVTISQTSETTVTYSSSLTINRDIKGDGFDLLRGLVLNMLKEQGIDFKIATGETGAEEIDISQLTQQDAQALIADDGYFGVDKTSSRIVDFAIGIAGGDPSRLDAIKEGVDKGFAEALKAFGGQLPDISYDTYDAVMKKLDDWAENTAASQS